MIGAFLFGAVVGMGITLFIVWLCVRAEMRKQPPESINPSFDQS